MEFTKRQMLLIPEVNQASFVFFFERGNSGTSWSIRDYSIANQVPRRYSRKDFPWTAEDILNKSRHAVNAPTESTGNLAFWHDLTIELNRKYGISMAASDPVMAVVKLVQATPTLQTATFLIGDIPILNLEKLRALPKNRKRGDMDRILNSPDSEDWVTWNFFQILLAEHPVGWWGHILRAVRRRNPDLVFPFDDQSPPLHELWKLVRSPSQYEVPSRARMRASERPTWVTRANDPRPVEGPSEIDIAVEHDKFVVFIEAKLGSDISMETTYDPQRNQIIRNIDCLIEIAGERVPIFWLLVRDQKPARAYVQLMNSYRSNPGLLARELPHRSAETLNRVARNLTVLVWSDFKELVCQLGTESQTNAVKHELERRILGHQLVG